MSSTINPQYIKFPVPERETKEHDSDDFGCHKHETRDYDTGCWRKPKTDEWRKPETRDFDTNEFSRFGYDGK